MDADRWRELNRDHWDELVAIHTQGAFHDVAGFAAGASTLRPFERDELGPVRGYSLVHAQCHFGLDSLSWAREGVWGGTEQNLALRAGWPVAEGFLRVARGG
jgi:hypothetical protein